MVELHGFSGYFQKNSEEQLAALQKLHAEELASKEQELTRRLETRETELQEQMRVALVSANLRAAIHWREPGLSSSSLGFCV